MASEKEKKDIQNRIDVLIKELEMHSARANQARQILNMETQQMIAKQGAVEELKKLIE